MPTVSVIVPVYNVEPYLRACVDSVLGQSVSDFELLLIDDGSTDASGAICDEYAARDTRVRVIHKENAGQGPARNLAMGLAEGKYIIFLDSDDYWEPGTLARLLDEAEKNALELLVFSALCFEAGGEATEPIAYFEHSAQNGLVKNGAESLLCAQAHGEYCASPCLRLYRTDFLRGTGLRFAEGVIHEDEAFGFLSYLKAARVECIGDRLYHRRYRPGSTMNARTRLASTRGCCAAFDEVLAYYLSQPLSEEEKRACRWMLTWYLARIFDMYDEAASGKGTPDPKGSARAIAAEARPTCRRARVLLPWLPWRLRVFLLSPAASRTLARLKTGLSR